MNEINTEIEVSPSEDKNKDILAINQIPAKSISKSDLLDAFFDDSNIFSPKHQSMQGSSTPASYANTFLGEMEGYVSKRGVSEGYFFARQCGRSIFLTRYADSYHRVGTSNNQELKKEFAILEREAEDLIEKHYKNRLVLVYRVLAPGSQVNTYRTRSVLADYIPEQVQVSIASLPGIMICPVSSMRDLLYPANLGAGTDCVSVAKIALASRNYVGLSLTNIIIDAYLALVSSTVSAGGLWSGDHPALKLLFWEKAAFEAYLCHSDDRFGNFWNDYLKGNTSAFYSEYAMFNGAKPSSNLSSLLIKLGSNRYHSYQENGKTSVPLDPSISFECASGKPIISLKDVLLRGSSLLDALQREDIINRRVAGAEVCVSCPHSIMCLLSEENTIPADPNVCRALAIRRALSSALQEGHSPLSTRYVLITVSSSGEIYLTMQGLNLLLNYAAGGRGTPEEWLNYLSQSGTVGAMCTSETISMITSRSYVSGNSHRYSKIRGCLKPLAVSIIESMGPGDLSPFSSLVKKHDLSSVRPSNNSNDDSCLRGFCITGSMADLKSMAESIALLLWSGNCRNSAHDPKEAALAFLQYVASGNGSAIPDNSALSSTSILEDYNDTYKLMSTLFKSGRFLQLNTKTMPKDMGVWRGTLGLMVEVAAESGIREKSEPASLARENKLLALTKDARLVASSWAVVNSIVLDDITLREDASLASSQLACCLEYIKRFRLEEKPSLSPASLTEWLKDVTSLCQALLSSVGESCRAQVLDVWAVLVATIFAAKGSTTIPSHKLGVSIDGAVVDSDTVSSWAKNLESLCTIRTNSSILSRIETSKGDTFLLPISAFEKNHLYTELRNRITPFCPSLSKATPQSDITSWVDSISCKNTLPFQGTSMVAQVLDRLSKKEVLVSLEEIQSDLFAWRIPLSSVARTNTNLAPTMVFGNMDRPFVASFQMGGYYTVYSAPLPLVALNKMSGKFSHLDGIHQMTRPVLTETIYSSSHVSIDMGNDKVTYHVSDLLIIHMSSHVDKPAVYLNAKRPVSTNYVPPVSMLYKSDPLSRPPVISLDYSELIDKHLSLGVAEFVKSDTRPIPTGAGPAEVGKYRPAPPMSNVWFRSSDSDSIPSLVLKELIKHKSVIHDLLSEADLPVFPVFDVDFTYSQSTQDFKERVFHRIQLREMSDQQRKKIGPGRWALKQSLMNEYAKGTNMLIRHPKVSSASPINDLRSADISAQEEGQQTGRWESVCRIESATDVIRAAPKEQTLDWHLGALKDVILEKIGDDTYCLYWHLHAEVLMDAVLTPDIRDLGPELIGPKILIIKKGDNFVIKNSPHAEYREITVPGGKISAHLSMILYHAWMYTYLIINGGFMSVARHSVLHDIPTEAAMTLKLDPSYSLVMGRPITGDGLPVKLSQDKSHSNVYPPIGGRVVEGRPHFSPNLYGKCNQVWNIATQGGPDFEDECQMLMCQSVNDMFHKYSSSYRKVLFPVCLNRQEWAGIKSGARGSSSRLTNVWLDGSTVPVDLSIVAKAIREINISMAILKYLEETVAIEHGLGRDLFAYMPYLSKYMRYDPIYTSTKHGRGDSVSKSQLLNRAADILSLFWEKAVYNDDTVNSILGAERPRYFFAIPALALLYDDDTEVLSIKISIGDTGDSGNDDNNDEADTHAADTVFVLAAPKTSLYAKTTPVTTEDISLLTGCSFPPPLEDREDELAVRMEKLSACIPIVTKCLVGDNSPIEKCVLVEIAKELIDKGASNWLERETVAISPLLTEEENRLTCQALYLVTVSFFVANCRRQLQALEEKKAKLNRYALAPKLPVPKYTAEVNSVLWHHFDPVYLPNSAINDDVARLLAMLEECQF